MAKETEAQRKARLKYRKEKTHLFQIQFPIYEYNKLYAYCKHINMPIATWVRSLIWKAIDSDNTFSYDSDTYSEEE